MNILVVNDDGIQAVGIRELVKCLGAVHRVYVSAPTYPQSGASHSAEYYKRDMKAYPHELEGAYKAWSVTGTPADCVYAALYGLCDEPIDLVVSGINHGWNISTDIHYSGTVAAGFEGLIRGIPAMAVSLADADYGEDRKLSNEPRETDGAYYFKNAAEAALELIPWFLQQDFKDRILLNINVPSIPREEIKGYKAAGMEIKELYEHCPEKTDEADGSITFRFKNNYRFSKGISDGDVTAVINGYIALTPLKLNWTDEEALKKIAELE